MFEQTFKNIDNILHKDAGCGSELYYTDNATIAIRKHLQLNETDLADFITN